MTMGVGYDFGEVDGIYVGLEDRIQQNFEACLSGVTSVTCLSWRGRGSCKLGSTHS